MCATDGTEQLRTVDVFERGFVALFAALAAASAVAIALVWTGHFRAVLLMPLGSAAAIAAVTAVTWSQSGVRRRPFAVRAGAACVGLAVVSGLLFLRPAEYVFDGHDGSVYHAMAAILERHGTLHPRDPVASGVTGSAQSAVFARSFVPTQLDRFPGGLRMQADTQELRPEFLHLFPIWMAAAGSTVGDWSRAFVNPVMAVLGVLTLWLLGRRLAGPLAGELSALLLAANLAQIYFARFPSAEITAQFLIVAGLYLTVLALDTAWSAAAVCAGIAFGLSAFARIEAMVVVAPAVACWLAVAIIRRGYDPPIACLTRSFAVATLAAVVYALTSATAYMERLLATSLGYLGDHPERLAVVGVAGGVLLFAGSAVVFTRARSGVRPLLLAFSAGLVSWLIWKDVSQGSFSSLITLPGLAIAVVACATMFVDRASSRTRLVAVLFFAGMLYFGNPMDQRSLPWNLRRYVPLVLPIACLAIAYAAATIGRRYGRARALAFAPALIVVWFAMESRTLIAYPLMRHGHEELAKLKEATAPSGILLWDEGMPSHLPLAAQYLLGRESVIVRSSDAFADAIPAMVDDWLAQGRHVQLVVNERLGPSGRSPWRSWLSRVSISRGSSIDINSEVLRTVGDGLVFRVAHPQRPLDFYTLRPGTPEPLPLRMDVGGPDLPFLLAGFHAAERRGANTFRWTAGEASVFVPAVMSRPGRPPRLSIRAAAGRLTDGRPIELAIDWNSQPLARISLAADLAEYHVDLIGTDLGEPSRLTFRVPTFMPRLSGGSEDGRTLGVLVDWIAIEEARPLPTRTLDLHAPPSVVARRR